MGVEATPDNMVPCNVTGQDTFCCGVGCKCDANHEIHTFTAPAQTLTIIGVSSSFPAPTATHAANQSAGVAPASHSAVATLGPGERTVQEAEVATTELALKIGAGLGVPLLVIFISLLVWCFYRRGKKAVLLKQVVEAQKQQAAALEAGEGAQTWGRVHEAPGMPVVFAELPANYKGSEMPVRESLVKESVSRTSTASGERTARSTKGASQSTASGGSVVMVSRGGSRSTASSGTIRIMEMTAPNEDTRINQI
ncbi:MAG: hypothetical protein M1832_002689 [Thelocarpon impressellum]|nr:MAG: hypothetical protein M1832_002689 [Thelocarpon impressellum]